VGTSVRRVRLWGYVVQRSLVRLSTVYLCHRASGAVRSTPYASCSCGKNVNHDLDPQTELIIVIIDWFISVSACRHQCYMCNTTSICLTVLCKVDLILRASIDSSGWRTVQWWSSRFSVEGYCKEIDSHTTGDQNILCRSIAAEEHIFCTRLLMRRAAVPGAAARSIAWPNRLHKVGSGSIDMATTTLCLTIVVLQLLSSAASCFAAGMSWQATLSSQTEQTREDQVSTEPQARSAYLIAGALLFSCWSLQIGHTGSIISCS